ncbi:MAG: TrbC/VirB2 family protein, partial [Candidatus Margulisbacteria bacterium]|nr:TrbC/VirB2 family protein [Candidatus Margulisiibacteriota bacterium]
MKSTKVLKMSLFVSAVHFWGTKGVFASRTTGLPWESGLVTLQQSLTGPVAMAISVIAIVVAGATLIFGGEIGEFARRMIMIVLV